MIGLDAYTARARLAPAAIAALPALALLGGGLLAPSEVARLGTTAVAAIRLLASQLSRDAGRRLQSSLWDSWGGPPTVTRLRHRGAPDGHRVERLHERFRAALGARLPTKSEEATDPAHADAVYEDAVSDLRNRTRDRARFPLVFEENADYGFRRNMLGLKPWALTIALAVLATCAIAYALSDGTASERLRTWGWPAGVACLALLMWWRVVTHGWVRLTAESYTDRLFEALDTLRGGTSTESPDA
jgi:hypothetical protein